MKILLVTNMYPDAARPANGIFVKEQVDALQRAGVDVDVLVLPVYRSRIHYILGAFRVFWRTLTVKYDIVHAHYGFTGVVCLLRARGALVTTFHGSDVNIPWQRKISALAVRFSDRSIFVSEKLHRLMRGSKGVVIPCGVDLAFFKPCDKRSARSAAGLPEMCRLVIFPGNKDNAVKNYPLFKQMMALLNDTEIQEMELWGWDRKMIPTVLAAADVMVMTSLQEGSPMVVKEALACNVPVVSVDVGDVAELIASVEGCRICRRDPVEIAVAVTDALSVRDFAGRERVRALDNGRIAGKLMEVYRAICAE